jgi:hypothetical protein
VTDRTTHCFTFGQSHMASYALPNGGRLADYWVAVEASDDHRARFIEQFTVPYCPRPMQFAMEYSEDNFSPEYFPGGELLRITAK